MSCARLGEGFVVGVSGDVHDAASASVGFGPAEPLHVDVFTRDRANNVRAGDEHAPLRPEDDDVGEGWAIGRATRSRPEHDRDLRDASGGAGHDVEDLADGVQRNDAFGQPGAAGVPKTDDGDVVGECAGVGGEDDLASLGAHGAAHDGGIRGERDRVSSLDHAVSGEHAGVAVGGELHERAGVEEGSQSLLGVARVVCARNLGFLTSGGVFGAGSVTVTGTLRKASATLWPPKPNELFRAIAPGKRSSASLRGLAVDDVEGDRSGSRLSMLMVGGTRRSCRAKTHAIDSTAPAAPSR